MSLVYRKFHSCFATSSLIHSAYHNWPWLNYLRKCFRLPGSISVKTFRLPFRTANKTNSSKENNYREILNMLQLLQGFGVTSKNTRRMLVLSLNEPWLTKIIAANFIVSCFIDCRFLSWFSTVCKDLMKKIAISTNLITPKHETCTSLVRCF